MNSVYKSRDKQSACVGLRSLGQRWPAWPGRALGLLLCAAPLAARAHAEVANAGSFLSGLLHPVTGTDHALAMLAVGLWGAQLGGQAVWVLPVAFPFVMALGALAGIAGLPMLATETGIALSVLLLGVAIALRAQLPMPAAVALVSVFAVFHGHAHGTEMPRHANATLYGVGFVVSTGWIHLMGIALGRLSRLPHGDAGLRWAGAAIAGMGVALSLRS